MSPLARGDQLRIRRIRLKDFLGSARDAAGDSDRPHHPHHPHSPDPGKGAEAASHEAATQR